MLEELFKLPEYFNVYNFELDILRRFNSCLRLLAADETITFDMSKVLWIDLFCLPSLLFMIDKVLGKSSYVDIKLPSCHALMDDPHEASIESLVIKDIYKERQKVCSFLQRWGFFDIVEKKTKVSTDLSQQNFEIWRKAFEDKTSFVLELSEITKKRQLEEIKQSLNDEKKLRTMFEEYSSLSIIESGLLANTIIWELGLNIDEHADAQNGYLTVHIVKDLRSSAETADKRSKFRQNYSTDWEKTYFEDRPYDGFVEVIVADDGSGIYKTLKRAFSEHFQVPEESAKEVDILDWAFEEFSSRKQEKKRDDATRTGLFWVRKCISDHEGFISLRSGSSIVSYNFAHQGSEIYPFKRTGIEYFEGTQIKIFLPLRDTKFADKVSVSIPSPLKSLKRPTTAPIIFELKYEISLKPADIDEVKWVLTKLDDYCSGSLPFEKPIYLNFDGIAWDKERMDRFFKGIYSIGQSASIILINFDKRLIPVLQTTNAIEKFKDNFFTPIVCDNLEIFWLGSNEKYSKIFSSLVSNGQMNEGDISLNFNIDFENTEKLFQALIKNDHLFRVSRPYTEKVVKPCFNALNIEEYLEEISKNKVNQSLTKTNALMKGQFFFPAGNYYSEYYIEARRLLEDPETEKFIVSDLRRRLLLKNIKADVILTSTPTGRELAALLSESCDIKRFTYFPNYYFNDFDLPITPIKDGDSVLIVTDVIGSGNLVIRLEKTVQTQKAKVVGICSIINTSGKSFEKSGIPEITLLHFPFNKSSSMPDKWNANELQVIDPTTTSPITKSSVIEANHIAAPEHFWKMIEETKSIYGEHIIYRERHYQYFIYPKIVFSSRDYGDFLTTQIAKCLDNKPIDNILYPSESDISSLLDKLIEKLSRKPYRRKMPRGLRAERIKTLLGFEYHLSETYKSDLKGKNILIVDDGANTGKTLDDLVHIATGFGAKSIDVFVFVNRLGLDKIKSVFGMETLSRVPIKFYFYYWLRLPVFQESTCPMCQEILSLKKDKLKYSSPVAQRQIEGRIKNLFPGDISKIEETTKLENLVTLAKLKEYANKVQMDKLLSDFESEKELSKTEALFVTICDVANKVLGTDVLHKIANICESVIDGHFKLPTHFKETAIKTLSDLDPELFVQKFPTLLMQLSQNIGLYYPLLSSCSLVLKRDISMQDKFHKAFETVSGKIEDGRRQAFGDVKLSQHWERLDRINYDFRQDLKEDLPLKKKELFATKLTFCRQKVFPSQKVEHTPLAGKVRKFKDLLNRIVENVGGDREMNLKHLVELAPSWNDASEELKGVLVCAATIYRAGDIYPRDYFVQDELQETMISDLQLLESMAERCLSGNIVLEEAQIAFQKAFVALQRLYNHLFDDKSSFRKDLNMYFVDLTKLVNEQLKFIEEQFSQKKIHVLLPTSGNSYIVLCYKSDLERLIHNLLNDSIRYGFKWFIGRKDIENQIAIKVEKEDDYINLEYQDNGCGFIEEEFQKTLKNREKTWGQIAHRLDRYGAKIECSSQENSGVYFKIKFLEG